jgi:hypothetical protein
VTYPRFDILTVALTHMLYSRENLVAFEVEMKIITAAGVIGCCEEFSVDTTTASDTPS